MDELISEIRLLRAEQRSDFDAVMLALATQRDAIQKGLDAQREALSAYQTTNDKILDRLQAALVTSNLEHETRFRRLEARLDSVENRLPPAA